MQTALTLLVWLGASFFSREYAAGYWAVGAIFGGTLLFCNRAKVFKGFSPQHLFLFISSVLIYALVYLISAKGWKFKNDWLDMLAGGISGGVIVGSILLPAVQGMLLGTDFKLIKKTALKLIAVWYLTLIASKIFDAMGLSYKVDFLWISIALWQGVYLKYLKI